MNRRLLPLIAVALLGVLAGAWLVAGPPPRTEPIPPRPHRTPAAIPRLPLAAEVDTGPAAPPPPAPDRAPTEVLPIHELVPMVPVVCSFDPIPSPRLRVKAEASAIVLGHGLAGGADKDQVMASLENELDVRLRGAEGTISTPAGTDLLHFTDRVGGQDIEATMGVEWGPDGGACMGVVLLVPRHTILVQGTVRGLLEGEWAWVEICELQRTRVDAADPEFELRSTLPEGPCPVRARRMDGLLQAVGPEVMIDPGDGDTRRLVLELPEQEVGGIGVPVKPHPDGMALGPPHVGGPADLAGLGTGDVVIAVDGEEVAGLSIDEIIARVTGPVGSQVELTVRSAEGEETLVRLQRQYISDGR